MANTCALPVKDDCSFLFLKLYYYFLKFLMVHRVYEQNRCAGQSTACNLQGFMFQVPVSVVPLHYACLYQMRTDAQHCEIQPEH